jgi:hypothetical protein
LPVEKKPEEVARLNRFDFGAKTFDGVTMDASEETAVAPLG